ncbi:hypothetical protein PC9H_010801 [Pleurotus ostreatus]|uniref:L-ornithine N(5)-monooxygenase [NAD(P)H] n=1 Tax=Pleurotus ostreatus TaxID=5322 RepID=A0A8H6ZKJ0_PLEOS|nr:uncharacterized protein PC9H_010801 [Pleurotus ostreatus]KAF7422645.1 hypothetical protein PC9H_010801 [Pleurotus ostreatus]
MADPRSSAVGIIGAGAAGLITGYTLLQDGFEDIQLLTRDTTVDTWSVYGEFRFSPLPMPETVGRLTGEDMRSYMSAFANEFLNGRIRCNTEVLEIKQHDSGDRWLVEIEDTRSQIRQVLRYAKIVLCTGSVDDEVSPAAAKVSEFNGPVNHSSQFRSQMVDLLSIVKPIDANAPDSAGRIVIVGGGKSAQDIAAYLTNENRKVSVVFERADAVLGFSGITQSTQVRLLQSTVALFASPDGYAGPSIQAAIASSSGSFTSVWQSGDGYAYGVTHLVNEGADTAATDMAESESRDRLNRDSVEASIDELLRRPILGASEHDQLSVCQSMLINTERYIPEPAPPSTAVVDAAITLFSQLLPLQDSSSSPKIIGSMVESTRPRSEGRREALVDGDPVLRKASSECIGRLANIAGTNFLTNQMKSLVDQVVNNRDPYGRVGRALAFSIYTFVGGMTAGPLLKTTVNVLMSLSNDPHPLVHFWPVSLMHRPSQGPQVRRSSIGNGMPVRPRLGGGRWQLEAERMAWRTFTFINHRTLVDDAFCWASAMRAGVPQAS